MPVRRAGHCLYGRQAVPALDILRDQQGDLLKVQQHQGADAREEVVGAAGVCALHNQAAAACRKFHQRGFERNIEDEREGAEGGTIGQEGEAMGEEGQADLWKTGHFTSQLRRRVGLVSGLSVLRVRHEHHQQVWYGGEAT